MYDVYSSIGQDPTFSCQQIVMKYCHGMTNDVVLTFSVGDTTLQFTVSIAQIIKICDSGYHTYAPFPPDSS